MNENSRLIAALVIIVLLIGAWAVSSNEPVEPIHIPLTDAAPDFVPATFVVEQDGATAIEFNPLLAVAALIGLIAVPTLAIGFGLTFLTTLLEKQVTTMKDSDDFKTATKTITNQENALLKGMNEAAPTYSMTDEDYQQPRWNIISTSAAIWLSLVFVAAALSDTLYPEGVMTVAGKEVSSTNFFILIFTLGIVALALIASRTNLIDLLNSNEKSGLPYDNIYLILTGGVFIFAGIGLIGWIRNPTFAMPENIFLPFVGSFFIIIVIGAVLLAIIRSPYED